MGTEKSPGPPPGSYFCNDPEEILQRKNRFLEELAKTGNIAASCRAAHLPRPTAYEYKRTDGNFAIAWDVAMAEAVDSLENEAWRRGRDGYDKPVFQGGQQVGVIREFSDSLLMFLLRGHRGELFHDKVRQEVTGAGGAPFFESLSQQLSTVYGNGDRDLDDGPEPSS